MNWSIKKQLLYGFSFILLVIIFFGIPLYFLYFNKASTCFDRKQNQGEQGIDCGGPCSLACENTVVKQPIILWSRAFPISNGKYNLVAYIQNPNTNYITNSFSYVFNVFDDKNVIIGNKQGTAVLNSDKNLAIFEQSFDANQRNISKTTFEINSNVTWKKNLNQKDQFNILTDPIDSRSGVQTLNVRIQNKTIKQYNNLYVIAIVYGTDGNAIAVSRTIVNKLDPNGEAKVIFTWPNLQKFEYSKVEIIPVI